MATVEAALYLAGLLFSVIPVERRGKHPLVGWAEFQKRRATETEIRSWWKSWPDCNIGVVTGEISDLFVVDLDGDEALKSAQSLQLPSTWIVKTGKGWHYYYRYPGPIAKNSVRTWPGIDVRTDGGYVVAAGSTHENGHVYAWGIAPDELQRYPIPLQIVERLAKPTEKPSTEFSANRFLPVTHGSRNDTAARLAGYLIRKQLPKSELAQIMQFWNEHNSPPIDAKELADTIESIWKREPSGETQVSNFNPIPLEDLILKTPLNTTYLWKPYIESNGLALLVAMPKVGKSVFCAHLSRAIVNGTEFLEGPVRQGKVLMIELEESNQRLVARCRDLGVGKNVYVHMGAVKTTEELYAKLETYIQENQIVLVIVNTLVRFLDVQDENDARQIARAMAPLLDLRRRVDCAFLVVHHTNKMDDESPRGIRGSGDLFAAVDTAMILRADDPTSPREMLAWSRDPAVPFKTTMRLLDGALQIMPNLERRKAYRA